MSNLDNFALFRRENPNVLPLGKGESAEIRNPLYRHREYIAPRNAKDGDGFPPNSGMDPITSSSRSPSPEPTLAPSEFPSAVADVLTKVPTAGPSISESPSKAPILLPTEDNNNADTTAGPSILESPIIEDNNSKPIIDCSMNADGDVNADANADNDYVNFKYKIVTQKGGANLEKEVLPPLEEKLLEMIIPNIFQCDTDQRALTATTYNSSRRLALLGASAKPPDVVSSKGKSRFCSVGEVSV